MKSSTSFTCAVYSHRQQEQSQPHQGNGFSLWRNNHHSQANSHKLTNIETMRSDQATFQPISGVPMNWRKTRHVHLLVELGRQGLAVLNTAG